MTTGEAGSARELVGGLSRWLDRLFPDVGRGERLTRALVERFGHDGRAVTRDVCREVESVAHPFSRHFELEHAAGGGLVLDVEPPGWPAQTAEEVEARGGQVGAVRREPGGVGILALDGHDDVQHAAPYLQAAFELLRGASGVVLDLRRDGGGDPGTVMLVLDWLLGGPPQHIADVVYRDRTRQWWTTGRLAESALPAEVPVAVLVGERTFSSGEALAYFIQCRGRARVVGRRTPGAADHVTPVNVTSHVRALVPEAYVRDIVTGGNWERTGVVPDIPCEPAEALEVALEILRAA
jgi:C-terminal processing protease CtpA/Prc